MKQKFTPELKTEKERFIWEVAEAMQERKNIMLLRDRYSNNHHQKDRIEEEIEGYKSMFKDTITKIAKRFQVSEKEVKEVTKRALAVFTDEDLEQDKIYFAKATLIKAPNRKLNV
jgi:hypothetical protein